MDTYPPLFYLNDKSKEIINLVNEYNKFEQKNVDYLKVFYSFDAGPNAFLFTLDEHLNELVYLINFIYFGEQNHNEFLNNSLIKNIKIQILDVSESRKAILREHFKIFKYEKENIFIKYLIHSNVGEDPTVIKNDWSNSLLDKNGELKQ